MKGKALNTGVRHIRKQKFEPVGFESAGMRTTNLVVSKLRTKFSVVWLIEANFQIFMG